MHREIFFPVSTHFLYRLCTLFADPIRLICRCRTSTNQLLTEALKQIPVSVVVFHRPDWTDESVSSIILDILERGVAEDSEGNSTSFRKSVVIIISPILEREFLMNASFLHRSKVETELKKQVCAILNFLTFSMMY